MFSGCLLDLLWVQRHFGVRREVAAGMGNSHYCKRYEAKAVNVYSGSCTLLKLVTQIVFASPFQSKSHIGGGSSFGRTCYALYAFRAKI